MTVFHSRLVYLLHLVTVKLFQESLSYIINRYFYYNIVYYTLYVPRRSHLRSVYTQRERDRERERGFRPGIV